MAACKLVTDMAHSCQATPPYAGFDPMMLIEIGVQVAMYLIQCWQKNHPNTPAKEAVMGFYEDGQYNARFLGNMVRRVHRAARAKGETLTSEQARTLAIQSLDTIRLGDEGEIQQAIDANAVN